MDSMFKKSFVSLSVIVLISPIFLPSKGVSFAEELFASSSKTSIKNDNIKILEKEFDEKKMTSQEIKIFNDLLDEAISHLSVQDKEQTKQELKSLLKGYMFRDGWITTDMLAGVLNVVIGAALAPYGVNSINLLIAKMGEYQAKQLVRSVVVDAVRNQLFRLGLSGAATIWDSIAGAILSSIINPGGAVANWIDSQDIIPNNGRLEFW